MEGPLYGGGLLRTLSVPLDFKGRDGMVVKGRISIDGFLVIRAIEWICSGLSVGSLSAQSHTTETRRPTKRSLRVRNRSEL